MKQKIFMGTLNDKFSWGDNNRCYLTKHTWDCGWYWGMGYIGNRSMHTHFDSVFLKADTDVKSFFKTTKITQSDWWILRDLFIQAYSLRKTAEIYKHGGHQTSKEGITDIIKNELMVNQLNTDLEIILDKIWEIVTEISKRK